VALAELHHLIEKLDRAQAGRGSFFSNECEVQNAAVILLTAHRLDGPVRGRAGRNAGSRQSEDVLGRFAVPRSCGLLHIRDPERPITLDVAGIAVCRLKAVADVS
jgi:hypothetical protein